MASYNIKHIEYLRQKASLTYEQAVALLDRNDGDIGKALVELERRGALRTDAPASGSSTAPEQDSAMSNSQAATGKGKSFWDSVVDLFIKGLRIKLVIEKDSETIARLPVVYIILAIAMALHLAIISVILMFLTGCRIYIERTPNPDGDRRIRNYAKGAEQSVRSHMAGNRSGQNPFRRAPYNDPAAQREGKPDDKDDFNSFTIE